MMTTKRPITRVREEEGSGAEVQTPERKGKVGAKEAAMREWREAQEGAPPSSQRVVAKG